MSRALSRGRAGSNRQERRAQASRARTRSLDEWGSRFREGVERLSNTLMNVSFVAHHQIFDPDLEPFLFIAIAGFAKEIGRHPKPQRCLFCTTEWSSFRDPPPGGFFVARTKAFFSAPGTDRPALVSGVCQNCFEQHTYPQLQEHALDVYREIWPDLRTVDIADAPDGMQ